MNRAASLCAALTAFVLLFIAGSAEAKPRFGFELKLGLTAPLAIPPFNRFVRSTSVLRDVETEALLADEGIPYIADATHAPGLSATVLMTFRDFEFSGSIHNFNWSDSVLRYRGNKSVTRVNDNFIDDAGVEYEEIVPPQEVGEKIVDSPNLSLLTFDGGYRYYLSEGFIEAYLPVGAGIVRAQPSETGEPQWGLHLWGGFTTDLAISNIAFIFDARYHFIVTDESTNSQQSINNAVVTDEGVLSTLLSTFHFLSIQVGFRYGVN